MNPDDDPTVVDPETPRRETHKIFMKADPHEQMLRVARWLLLAVTLGSAGWALYYWFQS